MLEELFSSRVGTKLALALGRQPYREVYVYQLSKELGVGLGRTKQLMERLGKIGVVTSSRSGRTILYRLNANSRLAEGLVAIAHEDAVCSLPEEFRAAVLRLRQTVRERLAGTVCAVLLFGSVAQGKVQKGSDIDFYVMVGSKEAEERVRKQLEGALESFARTAEMHIFTEAEFRQAYRVGDDFLANVLRDGVVVFDNGVVVSHLLKGLPQVTKEAIRKRLSLSKEFIDHSFEIYKERPHSAATALAPVALHLPRAWLLLHHKEPGSKHDLAELLKELGETKFARITVLLRSWWDSSPPLEMDKEKLWAMMNFLKQKYDECERLLVVWE